MKASHASCFSYRSQLQAFQFDVSTITESVSFSAIMDVLPEVNSGYHSKDYWDERYAKEDHFDWFKGYDQIAIYLNQFISDKKSTILMLGCGNSSLSHDMYEDGFEVCHSNFKFFTLLSF